MEKLGESISLTSRYHLQANGQVERANQEIRSFLRTFCANRLEDWAQFLPWVEYAPNYLQYSATEITSFQCILGYQPPLFLWITNPAVHQLLTTGSGEVGRYGKQHTNT